jgi:hypothetical protein
MGSTTWKTWKLEIAEKSLKISQFLPILATFYETKITFWKKLVGGAPETYFQFDIFWIYMLWGIENQSTFRLTSPSHIMLRDLLTQIAWNKKPSLTWYAPEHVDSGKRKMNIAHGRSVYQHKKNVIFTS